MISILWQSWLIKEQYVYKTRDSARSAKFVIQPKNTLYGTRMLTMDFDKQKEGQIQASRVHKSHPQIFPYILSNTVYYISNYL